MKASIDSKTCTGHGMCYTLAPEVYTDDEHGYGQVVGENGAEGPEGPVAPGLEDQAENGAAGCPERAITLT